MRWKRRPPYRTPVYLVNEVEPDDKAVMVTAQITEYSDWPTDGADWTPGVEPEDW